ncbi:TonB-dependent siderophore receptor [Limnohabitans sp.]|uniref:TonB-dependent siderophore receptor n=1 Tax=Limnohabitans sp. TaxID=1907725 RepID=UPI00286F0818|nr:TonB-dependent siderophore receptor [Limnohabitans sp.]
MAKHSLFSKATRVHAAVALCVASCSSAWAQQTPTEITITDTLPSHVSGFDDVPAQALPFSTTIITNATLQDIVAQRVSDALRLDASVSDSYNSPAYWDILSVRGFTLDNRYNYRREGLPISAETIILMDNKERIELLKGTSGIQAGTSAPGGLVNYVVKRAPTDAEQKIRNLTFSYGQGNNRLAAADLGGRFGAVSEFGYRFNVAHEDLDPYIKDTKGHRDLVALAMDWRLKPGTVIDFEIEQSHREQMGVNGYSLLGGVLPSPVDPRVNLTRQYWTQPGVFDAMTGSMRLRQELDAGWHWTTQYGAQRLKTDDRLTYGFGYNCYQGIQKPSSNLNLCSQFTPDGKFEIDDYRSNNERRIIDAIQSDVSGSVHIGSLQHNLTFEVIRQRQLDRFPPQQAWNAAGEGSVYGGSTSSAAPDPTYPNTNRSEYSNEFSVKDHVEISSSTALWGGLRHVSFNKASSQNAPTPNTNAKVMQGDINLPWVGISKKLAHVLVYASHGHGLEQNATPNSGIFANPGETLGVGRSRQSELGIRNIAASNQAHWNAALFQIERPLTYDEELSPGYFQRRMDGKQTHQGIDLGADITSSQWKIGVQTQWLEAKISDVEQTSGAVGSTPLNVPKFVLRGMAEYRYTSIPSLRTGIRVSHEGKRNVTEDGNIQLPAWTTFGANAYYDTKVNNIASTWSLMFDNLEDKRYWRESPKQFGHYYLYPGAPRTLRATVQFHL